MFAHGCSVPLPDARAGLASDELSRIQPPCIALTNICAQLFSIIGNKIYVDPPYYREGLTVSACMTGVAGLLAVGTLWWIGRLNAKKEEAKCTEEYSTLASESIDKLGNKHPDFRYTS